MLHRTLCASLMAVLCPAVWAADPGTIHDPGPRYLDDRLQIAAATAESRTPSAPASAPATTYRTVTSSAFNPAVSLILDGKYAGFSRAPETYALAGFSAGPEALEIEEGFHLGGTELALSANVDDKFYGQFVAGFHHGEVEIEEAFFETLALGRGFTARGGRFLSGIGYLNTFHPHAWDFADLPLAYRALIGGHNLADDGVQLRWVAPSALFVELGAELLRGEAYPAGGAARDGKGATVGFVRLGGDVGASHAWRVGLSRYSAEAEGRESGDEDTPDVFSGDVDLTVLDFVWKWAPDGNARARNFKFQAEYLKRDENGAYDLGSAGTPVGFRGGQKGWYAQAIYQFMPRWRAGVRYAQADAGSVDPALAGTVLDAAGHEPAATSFMVDFSNSEFSRFRVQYTRDESRPDASDNQYYLQYIMSLGPHGAHAF